MGVTILAWVRERAWLLLPVLAGAFLRLYRLSSQVLVGDEMHAVRAALTQGLLETLTSYGKRDYSPPLAGLLHLEVAAGLQVSEALVRAPVVAVGLASLILLPLVSARLFGRESACVFAWLLALSPWHVYWTQVARSYGPVALLATVSVLLAIHGLRQPTARTWTWATVSGLLSIWFHLVAAPFVAGAAIAAAFLGLVHARPQTRWRHFAMPVLAGALFSFLLFLPALDSVRDNVLTKAGRGQLDARTWAEALGHSIGTSSPVIAFAFLGVAVCGVAILTRRSAREAMVVVFAVLSQVLTLWLFAPLGAGGGIVLARYLFVALPIVLLAASLTFAEVARRLAVRPTAVGLAVALVLFFNGPLPDRLGLSSTLALHGARLSRLQFDLPPVDTLPEVLRAPEIRAARKLAWITPSPAWEKTRQLEHWDLALGWDWTLVLCRHDLLADPRVRFHRLLPLDLKRLLEESVEIVVFDRAYVDDSHGELDKEGRRLVKIDPEREANRLLGDAIHSDARFVAWRVEPRVSDRTSGIATP